MPLFTAHSASTVQAAAQSGKTIPLSPWSRHVPELDVVLPDEPAPAADLQDHAFGDAFPVDDEVPEVGVEARVEPLGLEGEFGESDGLAVGDVVRLDHGAGT